LIRWPVRHPGLICIRSHCFEFELQRDREEITASEFQHWTRARAGGSTVTASYTLWVSWTDADFKVAMYQRFSRYPTGGDVSNATCPPDGPRPKKRGEAKHPVVVDVVPNDHQVYACVHTHGACGPNLATGSEVLVSRVQSM
jgi:hypothetical protein